MENKNKENAFPALHLDAHQGMSLRDYFAAKAMQSFVSVWYEDAKNNPETIAKKAYNVADAMLKQREL